MSLCVHRTIWMLKAGRSMRFVVFGMPRFLAQQLQTTDATDRSILRKQVKDGKILRAGKGIWT